MPPFFAVNEAVVVLKVLGRLAVLVDDPMRIGVVVLPTESTVIGICVSTAGSMLGAVMAAGRLDTGSVSIVAE